MATRARLAATAVLGTVAAVLIGGGVLAARSGRLAVDFRLHYLPAAGMSYTATRPKRDARAQVWVELGEIRRRDGRGRIKLISRRMQTTSDRPPRRPRKPSSRVALPPTGRRHERAGTHRPLPTGVRRPDVRSRRYSASHS